MEASIVDLRRRMPEVLRALDRNEEVIVTYRGRKRAVLKPVEDEKPPISAADHESFGMWRDRDIDVDAMVRRLRRGRYRDLRQ